jgi:hypothetical protein
LSGIIYLSGHVNPKLPPDVGLMMTERSGHILPAERIWAADNGCFATPHLFDPLTYIGWLAKHQSANDRCLFATMPDVVRDAKATLAKVQPWPRVIRALGYKAALVAQDGLESLTVPWDELDALFIGGSTEWKLGDHATALIREAKSRGKWVHAGRVNSLRRLRHVQWQGCDSADGTFCAFGPDVNIPRMTGWLQAIRSQPYLTGIG